MKVLVTGGAGYIGSCAVRQLVERGHDVVVLDNLSTGSREALVEEVTFYEGDIRNVSSLREMFKQEKIDIVMHFAAKLIAPESVSLPLEYYSNNVIGLHSILTVMKEFDVQKIVFSSTAAVYGLLDKSSICEDDPTAPINPYGETKLTCEKMIEWAKVAYGLEYVIFRYFNVAGGCKPGFAPTYQTALVPRVLCAAKGLTEKLYIYGNDYDTPDGTGIRDFVHVNDLAAAHVLAAEKMMYSSVESGVYNLGSGSGFSVMEVFEVSKRVTGNNIPFQISDRRPGDPVKSVASSLKAQEKLGWNRQYTTLESIVEDAWSNM